MAEDSKTPSDEELIQALRQSDQRALGVLYDRYSAVVFRLGLRVLQQTREAEDLTQEVFLYLWRQGKDSFDPRRGSLSGYLMTFARSRALDRIRRQQAANRSQQRLQMELPAKDERTPLEAASLDERSRRVREALSQLPAAQRDVLELAYFEGYSQSEIAERLSEPLGTVKTRARQGLIKLRRALTDLLA
jgi:RNA polymerase sigma-70 factor (ECF subfamily)